MLTASSSCNVDGVRTSTGPDFYGLKRLDDRYHVEQRVVTQNEVTDNYSDNTLR